MSLLRSRRRRRRRRKRRKTKKRKKCRFKISKRGKEKEGLVRTEREEKERIFKDAKLIS